MNKKILCKVNPSENVTWYGEILEEFLDSYSILSSHSHKIYVMPKSKVTVL